MASQRPLTPGPKLRVDEQHQYATMPPKKHRKHRWIGLATYVLTDDAAAAVYDPSKDVHFDLENLADMNVGCLDCEEPWSEAHGKPCRAEPYHWYR